MLKIEPIISFVKSKKYIIASILFLIWISFLSNPSLTSMNKSKKNINKIDKEIEYYSAKITQETGLNILFSPEFLREGMAIRDNQFPSRIIIGKTNQNQACDPYLSVAQEIAKNLLNFLNYIIIQKYLLLNLIQFHMKNVYITQKAILISKFLNMQF